MKRNTAPLESAILKQCLQYLALRRIPAWRSNSGAVTATSPATGKTRFIRFSGAKGLSDIIGLIPRIHGGIFLAVEVKRPGKKPTEEQEAFLEMVRQAGGVALVVTSVKELEEGLNGKSP